jgi:ATP-binding cassette subfamily B protein
LVYFNRIRIIGVVPQDTVLFNDSIRYNILYSKPTATNAELIAATKAAQV